MANRFLEIAFELNEFRFKKKERSIAQGLSQSPVEMTVRGGSVMDPFYRDSREKGQKGGRSVHLGIDISLPVAGDGTYRDPRRGTPVYAAISTQLSPALLNGVRVMDKNSNTPKTGLGLSLSGDATLVQGIIRPQPWTPKDDDSYGGIVGIACQYQYTNAAGAPEHFTIYVEYLHLITDKYLPKNRAGVVASAAEWAATGKPSGFGPEIKSNARWSKTDFLGPVYPLVGYLGATQTPHVHVQAAFAPGKVEYARDIRLDPLAIIY